MLSVSLIASEQLPIRSALNRVLAQPVVSAIDVPPFNNSAMDGYALRSTDCHSDQIRTFRIIGECFAGAPFTGRVNLGECVRIMTGAVMPEGADAVVMQEHVTRGERHCHTRTRPVVYAPAPNVRYAGEDTRRGDTYWPRASVSARQKLACSHLSVSVKSGFDAGFGWLSFPPAMNLTSVGGTAAGRDRSTTVTVTHCLACSTKTDIEAHDLGVIPDDREAVRAAFRQARRHADLVMTSGGVSVGEADYVTATLEELGEVSLWRMATKPGKPLAFGRLGQACFFGLPGNPVSVMATFYQFVLPAITRCSG